MIPTDSALKLHWSRSCWVIDMWRQAPTNSYTLQPLNGHRWTTENNSLSIVWDVPENVSKVCERVAVLFQGCSCKTGCKTRRCKCVQKSSKCLAGCKCLNCANLTLTPSPPRYEEDSVSSSDSDG